MEALFQWKQAIEMCDEHFTPHESLIITGGSYRMVQYDSSNAPMSPIEILGKVYTLDQQGDIGKSPYFNECSLYWCQMWPAKEDYE